MRASYICVTHMQTAPRPPQFVRLPCEGGLWTAFEWTSECQVLGNDCERQRRLPAWQLAVGVAVDPGLGPLSSWLEQVCFTPVPAASAVVGAVLMWKQKQGSYSGFLIAAPGQI